MKKSDRQILREIQRNAQSAIDTIKNVSDKVYDDTLALDLNSQAVRYEEIRDRTEAYLKDGRERGYRENPVERLAAWGGVQAGTLLNTSTGHIAEMMILKRNKGILSIYKTLTRNEDASLFSMEMAQELVEFDEKNINRLMEYL